jgi:pyridoxamine 5'-phosphate oxidase family protein
MILEIHGLAETGIGTDDFDGHLAPEVIRIHPRRIVGFNVDRDSPGFEARNVSADCDEDEVA